MEAPPLHLKLFLWMIDKANFKDHGKIKRGQFITTINEMREAMAYKIGYRKCTPTRDQIRNAYEAFTKATMITTMKTTRGMVINILNYELYQNIGNYETHSESHNDYPMKPTVTPHYKGKKGKERKECNNPPIIPPTETKKQKPKKFIPPTLDEVKAYFAEKGYLYKAAKRAFDFYSAADWHDSRGNKIKNWKQKMIGVWFTDENRAPKQQHAQQQKPSDIEILGRAYDILKAQGESAFEEYCSERRLTPNDIASIRERDGNHSKLTGLAAGIGERA